MTKFEEISYRPEFKSDMRKLRKKYRTLEDDLETLIETALYAYHKCGTSYSWIVQLSGLGFTNPEIYKVLHFTCKALKGKGARSGIRVIYAYYAEEDRIELVEIYHKNQKDNEDRARISKIYGTNTKSVG